MGICASKIVRARKHVINRSRRRRQDLKRRRRGQLHLASPSAPHRHSREKAGIQGMTRRVPCQRCALRRRQTDKEKAAGMTPAACSVQPLDDVQKLTMSPIRMDWPRQLLLLLLKDPWAVPFRLLPLLKLLKF